MQHVKSTLEKFLPSSPTYLLRLYACMYVRTLTRSPVLLSPGSDPGSPLSGIAGGILLHARLPAEVDGPLEDRE